MKRIALVVAGLVGLVACGDGGGWKAECSDTKPCPAGSYCATTGDGSVCWEDDVPPVVGPVTATCGGSTTCRRDATLHVAVDVTDDQKVGTVLASLDLDPARHVPLTKGSSGATYTADIALTDFPVGFYSGDVKVTVTATDDAQTPATGTHTARVTVTREAWAKKQLSSAALWSPAVATNGTLVVAARDGRLYFVPAQGSASSVPILTSPATLPLALSGPAAIGSSAIWVGSEDGRLYAVNSTGTVLKTCPPVVGGAMTGVPAISGSKAISATNSSRVVVSETGTVCNSTVVTSPGQPVVGSGDRLLIPTGNSLQNYTIESDGALAAQWTGSPAAPTVGTVTVPPAIDGSGLVWTTSLAGLVFRTNSSGSAQQLSPTSGVSENSTGVIILSDGSAVLGDYASTTVRRLMPNGSSPWASGALVNGHARMPLAIGGDTPSLLVATDQGTVHLLRQSDGHSLWDAQLTTLGVSLEPPNIWTEPGATTSTAYLAGADGYLYAVIVDGTLDTSAPWPKAYHDPQNTSHAGAAP
jgi:outer membrane protein assembly factor BamB